MTISKQKTPLTMAAVLTSWTRAIEKHDHSLASTNVKFTDAFIAAGGTWRHLLSPQPKKGVVNPESLATVDSWAEVKPAIIAGFSPAKRKLIECDIDTLSAEQKVERKKAQASIGSKIKDYRNSLKLRDADLQAELKAAAELEAKEREAKVEAEKAEAEKMASMTDVDKVLAKLAEVNKQLAKLEGATFSIPEAQKKIKAVINFITKK